MFGKYTESLLSAFKFSPHQQDLAKKKYEIVEGVFHFYNISPDKILFVGFNPAILAAQGKELFVTQISDAALDFLKSQNIKVTNIPEQDLINFKNQFDAVVALDEYFTFANSDIDQQNKIKLFSSLAKDLVISTLKDYKNQDYKEREFSAPALIRNGTNKEINIESHDWDLKDRTAWTTTVYQIDQQSNTLSTFGPFDRRTMYFKQLAKFSLDAGAYNFLVHKNLMYKGLTKKNYEHVISITFNDGL